MTREVKRKAHENGHFSVKETRDILKNDYIIPQIDEKIQKVINTCILCILSNKLGKLEGFLHPLYKENPLQTYHIDHLGPLTSTNKKYFIHEICVVIPHENYYMETRVNLEIQRRTFGNLRQRDSIHRQEFEDYCANKRSNISQLLICQQSDRQSY